MADNPAPASLKGKRKKKMPENPNPLFTQWLTEWKDEANEKGWKSAHTYGKALKTLKLFPLPLESGKDCKLLRNFGDKICKMLDEKLLEYKLNGGVLPDTSRSDGSGSSSVVDIPPRHSSASSSDSSRCPTANKQSAPPNGNQVREKAVPYSSHRGAAGSQSTHSSSSAAGRTHTHTISDDSGSDTEQQGSQKKPQKATRSRDTKEYIPAYRSGPYALILSLYRTMQTPGYRGFVLKADLCEAAQPLADKSFTIPDPGSRYTAWSSMGTLIRKGLIIKYSNPAKFFLTEAGQALAERLEEAENRDNNSSGDGQPAVRHNVTRHPASDISQTTSPAKSRVRPTTSSPFSKKAVGSQRNKIGDTNLETASNARQGTDNNNTGLLKSSDTGYLSRSVDDLEIEEAINISNALDKSLCTSSGSGLNRVRNLDISMEDTVLEAALKASLEESSSQSAPQRKEKESNSGLTYSRAASWSDMYSEQDTDLEAALKASLQTCSAEQIESKESTNPAGSGYKSSVPSVESETALPYTSPPHSPHSEGDDLSFSHVSPLKPLSSSYHADDDSDEDDDMKKAIAESLLSYSQELSTSQNAHSGPQTKKNVQSTTSTTTDKSKLEEIKSSNVFKSDAANDSVFIVSDDENEAEDALCKEELLINSNSPERIIRKPHCLSPSPIPSNRAYTISSASHAATSTPAPTTALSPQLQLSPVKSFTSLVEKKHTKDIICADLKEAPPVPPHNTLSCGKAEESLVIIDDTCENNNRQVANVKSKSVHISADDSEDELPDLDVPLFQRLLNRGTIQSDLLKQAAESHNPQNSVPDNLVSLPPRVEVSATTASGSSLPKPQTEEMTSLHCHDSNHAKQGGVKSKDVFKPITNQGPSVCDSHMLAQQSTSQGKLMTFGEEIKSSSNVKPTCIPEFTLFPGTFDVVLCLDNREFYGSKSNSKTLLPDLMKSGIQCDLRLLHVGDLLWVARERVGSNNIHRVQGREVVLDFIVERKRMDDLVSSLTDGRMKEQKFRLKHCGLSNTIILIEEYGSIQNFSLSEDRIKQSIVNSQVIDGFKVKRCGSTKEAVSYLATLTRFLQQLLSNKTLHAVSVDEMKVLKGQRTFQESEQYLAQFTAFNEASIKHKDLTVTELLGKQLIQVPGISAERARAITSVYPTFNILMDAYSNCATEKEKEKLVATIKYGKNDRNLGIAVSRTLYMLYKQNDKLL